MPKRPRRNKRLDAPHVRLYRWMLDFPAYFLSCQARAVLVEIARGHDGTNNGRLASRFVGLPNGATSHAEPLSAPLSNSRSAALSMHDEGSIQPKGAARHRMASDLVELRCHRRTGEQEVHELGPRKTKRGIKISRRGIKSEPRAA